MNLSALIENKSLSNRLGQAVADRKFTMGDALMSTTGSVKSSS